MPGVLDGIKVIEMGHWIAVPAAAAVMADWGAEVIKVEPLTGDAMRHMEFVSSSFKRNPDSPNFRFDLHNRGKKSIALNLNTPEGRNIFYKLIQQSDVFMSNYQLSALEKFELGYVRLSHVKKDLVYAVLTGYGTVGAEKEQRGFDFAAAWARSGIQYLLAEPGNPPPQQLTGLMDRVACMNIVSGIMAALLHRQRKGQGQKLEFSLYHSGVWVNAGDILAAKNGETVLQNNRSNAMNPLWNTYKTKDDRWLQIAILEPPSFWKNFCAAIEKPELEKDERFSNIDNWPLHCKELIKILDAVFATKTAAEWRRRLQDKECIFDLVSTPGEVAGDAQAEVNHFFESVADESGNISTFVTSPVKYVQNPAKIKSPAPSTGQHTGEILKKLGFSSTDISGLKQKNVIA